MGIWVHALLIGDDGVGKRTLAPLASGYGPDKPYERNYSFYSVAIDSTLGPKRPPEYIEEDAPVLGTNADESLVKIDVMLVVLRDEDIARDPGWGKEYFPMMHSIAICYDISDQKTLENAIHKWFPMARHFNPLVPILLIGCKSDLRESNGHQLEPFVSREQGEHSGRQIEAAKWLECTTLNLQTIDQVSQWIAWCSYRHKPTKTKGKLGCIIL